MLHHRITSLSNVRTTLTDGKPGLFPSTAEKHGRIFAIHLHGTWVNASFNMKASGLALIACDVVGVDWRQFTSFEQLTQAAQRIHEIAEHSVATDLEAPIAWLCQDLTIDLDALEAGLRKMAELGTNWKEMTSDCSAKYMLLELIPNLRAPEPVVEAPVVEPTPQQPQKLYGKARKLQRQREAAARKAETDAKRKAKSEAYVPGAIVREGDVEYYVCTGKRGKCKQLSTADKAQVGSLNAIKRCLNIR